MIRCMHVKHLGTLTDKECTFDHALAAAVSTDPRTHLTALGPNSPPSIPWHPQIYILSLDLPIPTFPISVVIPLWSFCV